MTEAEWSAPARDWEQAYAMLCWLGKRRKARRKLRLWGCACCRRAGELLTDHRSWDAIETSERYADGLADRTDLRAAKRPAWVATNSLGELRSEPGQQWCWAARGAALTLDIFISNVSITASGSVCKALQLANSPLAHLEQRAQIDLLHGVFGNPFRPVVFDPGWRTDAVVALARQMYDGRDFGPMPVLADALDDAGCTDPAVLGHLRGPGPHARGCWVVDLLLGKT